MYRFVLLANILLLTIFVLINPTRITAQTWPPKVPSKYTDFIAPGVPNNTTCGNKTRTSLLLKAVGPNTINLNKVSQYDIKLINTSSQDIKLSHINLSLSTSNATIEAYDLNKTLCKNTKATLTPNKESLTITFESPCNIKAKANSAIRLGTIKIKPKAVGEAAILLTSKNNPTNITLAKGQNVEVALKAVNFNLLVQSTQIVTPPETGDLDTTPIWLILSLTSISTIILLTHQLKSKNSYYEELEV